MGWITISSTTERTGTLQHVYICVALDFMNPKCHHSAMTCIYIYTSVQAIRPHSLFGGWSSFWPQRICKNVSTKLPGSMWELCITMHVARVQNSSNDIILLKYQLEMSPLFGMPSRCRQRSCTGWLQSSACPGCHHADCKSISNSAVACTAMVLYMKLSHFLLFLDGHQKGNSFPF